MDVMIRIGILVPFTMLIIKRTLAGELIGIGMKLLKSYCLMLPFLLKTGENTNKTEDLP